MKVLRLDHYGRGIINENGKTGFIKNALIDENIEYSLIKDKKKYFEGETTSIDNINPNRVNPQCPYYKNCGGCNLLHMAYNYQLKFKQNKVIDILTKFSDINKDSIEIESTNQFNYRNKVTFHIKNNKLGYYKNKSNKIIKINKCLLLDNKINNLIDIINKNISGIETVTIKLGNITNEVMLILEGNGIQKEPFINYVDVLVINNKVLSGKNTITSIIGDKRYLISAKSFFQVNEYLTEKLYNEVKNNIIKLNSKEVLDLYCGTGTIGIYISDEVNNVLGIEIEESSYLNAEANKELNSINNINFINGDVFKKTIDIKRKYDTAIVDPPRSGLGEKVINNLLEINPNNIIYISCDPITLSRDLNILKKYYNIENIKLFDMFPNTYHVECVCVMKLH